MLGRHEDCERPPSVHNGIVKLSDDTEEDMVTATYSCDDGYKLQGDTHLQCDLDSDEWQGEPPTCVKGKQLSAYSPAYDVYLNARPFR